MDFNKDGDGKRLWTLLEQAKREDMRVGVISTARITHATPAATFAHINDRNNENAIALQALPGDATYNRRLGDGIDLLFGGGRQFFVPTTTTDDEGGSGSRTDGRDLRASSRAKATRTSRTRPVSTASRARACPCSGCSNAATWSTNTTGRRTPAASPASRT